MDGAAEAGRNHERHEGHENEGASHIFSLFVFFVSFVVCAVLRGSPGYRGRDFALETNTYPQFVSDAEPNHAAEP
jgi:hypothetical protein